MLLDCFAAIAISQFNSIWFDPSQFLTYQTNISEGNYTVDQLIHEIEKETLKVFLLIGLPGIIYAMFYAITHVCFVYSIQNTSVANTLVIIAGAPIFAALFSIIFLKEKFILI